MSYNYSDISLNEFPGETSLVLYTGSCSLRCPWCFNPDLLNKKPLSYKQAKDAIDEHRDFITAVTITGGEPLMNPFLFRIIDYVRDNGLKVKLNTNGFVSLNKHNGGRCINWGLHVDYLHLSLKGPNLYNIFDNKKMQYQHVWGDTIEYSFVYSPTLWPNKYLQDYANNLCRRLRARSWLHYYPDVFTIVQLKTGNCLNPDFNSCQTPNRESCIRALKIFKELPVRRFMIETYEFGKEEIKDLW